MEFLNFILECSSSVIRKIYDPSRFLCAFYMRIAFKISSYFRLNSPGCLKNFLLFRSLLRYLRSILFDKNSNPATKTARKITSCSSISSIVLKVAPFQCMKAQINKLCLKSSIVCSLLKLSLASRLPLYQRRAQVQVQPTMHPPSLHHYQAIFAFDR